ncbi:MAG: ABC transporter substrate-binding protein [Escherichia coli]
MTAASAIFSICGGLQWWDGQPLTAEDFVLGWQRAVDPKTASPFCWLSGTGDINNAAAIVAGKADVTSLGVKAMDDHTLEVTLEQPVPLVHDDARLADAVRSSSCHR